MGYRFQKYKTGSPVGHLVSTSTSVGRLTKQSQLILLRLGYKLKKK